MIPNLTISPRRMLGPIRVQCTIEEVHTDSLTITDHPVERGAAISDHAYKLPAQLVMRVGWSNSSLQALLNPNYVREIYEQLLALQETKEPFDVTTGKRLYKNMLFSALTVTTDQKTESTLMCTATMREVIRVQTRGVSVPPADVQAEPKATAATAQTGVVQPRPATLSPPAAGG